MVLSHQGKKEFASPVEPMTPEALVLHFIDDLDSKLNQLRASREAAAGTSGISFSRGLGRYVYVPTAQPEDALLDPHAAEAQEADAPGEPVELQPGLFQS
jgi:3'-5' exoribonuclease